MPVEHILKKLRGLGLVGARVPGTQTVMVGNTVIKYHSRAGKSEWLLSAADEDPIADFYCFVRFDHGTENDPQDWLVPARIVGELLTKSHQAWLNQVGEQPHEHGPLRKFRLDYGEFPELLTLFGPGWADKYQQSAAWEQLIPPPA